MGGYIHTSPQPPRLPRLAGLGERAHDIEVRTEPLSRADAGTDIT